MSNFIVALFAGLYIGFALSGTGYTLQKVLKQPIVIAFFFGLLMGDMYNAIVIGAGLEMVYCGIMAPGGALPADEGLASVVAIPLALSTGADAGTAIALAAPIAALGGIFSTPRKILNSRIGVLADKYADAGDVKRVKRCAWYGIITSYLFNFLPVFLAVFLGQGFVEPLLDALPEWVTHGMSVAGGLLPAVGFAMIIYMIGKPSIFAFFFIGFFACKYLGLNVLSTAYFGIPMAIIILLLEMDNEKTLLQKAKALFSKAGQSDDDDDDDD